MFNIVLGIVGVAAACMVWWTTAQWWSMRSYVPVEGRLTHVELTELRRKKGSASYSLWIRYEYSVDGRTLYGNDPGGVLTSARTTAKKLKALPDGKVTVWVERRRPEISVLDRGYAWDWVAIMFCSSIAAFLTFYYHSTNRRVLSFLESSDWIAKTFFAALWNLLALPVISVALVVTAHPILWVLATLLVAVVGVKLALWANEIYHLERGARQRS